MLIWYLSELQWKIVTTYYHIDSLVNRSVYVLRVHFPNMMYYFQTDLLNINHYRAKYSWGKRRHICLFNNLPNLRPVSRPWDLLRYGGKISYNLMNKGPGADSIKIYYLTSIRNPIVEIRRSYDRHFSTMGFPILVRWHIYIESGPWLLTQTQNWPKLATCATLTPSDLSSFMEFRY